MWKASLFGLTLCFLFCGALAQTKTDQKPPSTTPTKTTPATPTTSKKQEPMPRVLFITGTLAMVDGSELPQASRVELLCDGRKVRQDSVSSNGSFDFNLGNTAPSNIPDASVSGWGTGMGNSQSSSRTTGFSDGEFRSAGLGRVDLSGCEIRMVPLAGFYSKPILLKSRSVFDNPDLGQIVVYRLDDSQGSTISLSTLSAPSKAVKAFEKAQKELTKKKPNYEKAIQQLEKAVGLYDGFAEAWNLLGELRVHLNDEAGARGAFLKSIEVDGRFLKPYTSLAQLEIGQGRYKEASQFTNHLVELNPHVPTSHYLNGLATYYMGQLDVAEESFLHLEKETDSEFYARSYLFLGMIHATQGLIPAAASDLQKFLETEPPGRLSPDLRKQLEEQLHQWQQQGLVQQSPVLSAQPPG